MVRDGAGRRAGGAQVVPGRDRGRSVRGAPPRPRRAPITRRPGARVPTRPRRRRLDAVGAAGPAGCVGAQPVTGDGGAGVRVRRRQAGVACPLPAPGLDPWGASVVHTLTVGVDGWAMHEPLRTGDRRSAAVLDRVEAVGADADPAWFPTDGLVHLDLHTDNVLADDEGRLTGIIDWDGACAGDPRFDLVRYAYDLDGHDQPVWERRRGHRHRAARASGVRRPPRAALHRLGYPSPPRGRAAPARPGRARPRSVRQLNPQDRFPDARTLDWVARAVAPGARVVGGRRLMGGITSSIHQLAVETRSGTRTHVVLRRWTPSEGDSTDGRTAVRRARRPRAPRSRVDRHSGTASAGRRPDR